MHVPMLTMLLGHHYYGRVGIYLSCNSILASHHSVYFSTHCPTHDNLTGKRLNEMEMWQSRRGEDECSPHGVVVLESGLIRPEKNPAIHCVAWHHYMSSQSHLVTRQDIYWFGYLLTRYPTFEISTTD